MALSRAEVRLGLQASQAFGCFRPVGALELVMRHGHVSYSWLCRRFGDQQDPPVAGDKQVPHPLAQER